MCFCQIFKEMVLFLQAMVSLPRARHTNQNLNIWVLSYINSGTDRANIWGNGAVNGIWHTLGVCHERIFCYRSISDLNFDKI